MPISARPVTSPDMLARWCRWGDFAVPRSERALLAFLVAFGGYAARFRRANRGPAYVGPYLLCAGGNTAITAPLYEQCGGRCPAQARSTRARVS